MLGNIEALVQLFRDGLPIVGEEIIVTISSGSFIEPPGGITETDETGSINLIISGGSLPLTFTAQAVGQSLYIMEPCDQELQVIAVNIDECTFDDSLTFETSSEDCPKTIGFWKHQLKAWKTGKGRVHVDSALIESWLPLSLFYEPPDNILTVSTLDGLHDILWVKNKAPMQERAKQQCMATLLNVQFELLDWYSMVDTDYDGNEDKYLYAAWNDASLAYEAGNFETAKDICDSINNMCHE
jgi:hypothetical protein